MNKQINIMYAKLINGDIQTSPIQIEVNGFIIMNPSSEHLIPLGYKEVIHNEITEEMINPTPQYTETDTNIIVSYVEGEIIAPVFDYEGRVIELIRKRYTVDQELAILRQRDVKADEYKIYFDYCEECKALSKKEMLNFK